MPILIFSEKEEKHPYFVCDACGKKIDNEDGIYACRVGNTENPVPIHFAHKGACHNLLEKMHPEARAWVDLPALPIFLMNNLDVSLSTALERAMDHAGNLDTEENKRAVIQLLERELQHLKEKQETISRRKSAR